VKERERSATLNNSSNQAVARVFQRATLR